MPIGKPFEFFIQWHLTEKCNLRCRHCYQSGRGAQEMSLFEIRETIAEISGMIREWSGRYGILFSPSMNITGGEPFMRDDLSDILCEIKKSGFEVSVLTNGTMLDGARAKMLADIGVDGVQVSMEGPEVVHDSVRGAGSFAAAAAGVDHLVGQGLNVTLNATLSRLNAGHTEKLIGFGSDAGVRRIGFSRLVPSGNGRRLLAHMLSKEEISNLYRSLLSRDPKTVEIATGDPLAGQMRNPASRDAGDTAAGGCAAGVSGLTIQPNGTILPCRRLPLPIGNVRKDSLREVWAASPVLEALRDRTGYKGKCGTCRRWALCRGCRAIAFAWSRINGGNNFLADDPQCFFQENSREGCAKT